MGFWRCIFARYTLNKGIDVVHMSQTLDLVEGMRIGIPFRAASVIEIDSKRFVEYDYEFPEQASITLIETSDDLADLEGYYRRALRKCRQLRRARQGMRL